MAMNVWDKFDKMIDLDALQEEIEAASENKREFRDVPKGDYEVKAVKFEIKESKNGNIMMVCQMRVLTGEYKNENIFYNQVIHMGFGIKKACDFLRSLDSGVEVKFDKSYAKFKDLLMDIQEAIDGKYEYALQYGEDDKGYSTYEIKEVFEVE